MDNHEIAPAPVSTPEELLSKMDMILGATRQWMTDDDDALGALIYRRVTEIPRDMSVVLGSTEHWAAFDAKAIAINKAFRQKAAISLHNLNSLN